MKTTMPKLINDMPVATERGHGLGTKSIRQSAERLGGKCQYLSLIHI